MHCRRHDRCYTLIIQSNRSFDDWRSDKIKMIVARTRWCPAADIYETNEKIDITLELAGVDPEKLEISLYKDALVIEGQRSLKTSKDQRMYYMAEIRQGPFCFEFPLPVPVDPDQIETHYKDGLLSIILKKVE